MAPQELATVPRGKALPYVYVAWPSVGAPGTFVPPWALCVLGSKCSQFRSVSRAAPTRRLSKTITQRRKPRSRNIPSVTGNLGVVLVVELCRAPVTGIAELRGIAWWIG